MTREHVALQRVPPHDEQRTEKVWTREIEPKETFSPGEMPGFAVLGAGCVTAPRCISTKSRPRGRAACATRKEPGISPGGGDWRSTEFAVVVWAAVRVVA